MKRLWIKQLAISVLVLGMCISVSAQQPEMQMQDAPQRGIPSPEGNARRITREFKKVFQLTDKEYDKVYELYLKQERALMGNTNGNGMPPLRGQGGPRGGFGGNMGGPRMGGGMPPQGNFQPKGDRQMPEDMKEIMEEMRLEQEKKQKKAAKKLTKKMKKLLTKEQFAQWEQWEAERKNKMRPDKH